MTTGAWRTPGRGSAGAVAGADNEMPADVDSSAAMKGWMPIGDVAAGTGVALAPLRAAVDLPPETPPEAALKDLASDTFSVPAVREWIDARAALASGAEPAEGAAP